MKKETLWLILLPFLTLGLGIIWGEYFGLFRAGQAVVSCEVQKQLIPVSPMVMDSYYDEEKWVLTLKVVNPGSMPVELVSKSVMLKPAQSNIPEVAMVEIPLGIVLNGWDEVVINMQISAEAKGKFKVGDVLLSTITYRLPVSRDLYSVVHMFTKSTDTNESGMVKSQNQSNETIKQAYEEKVKNTK